MGTQVVGTRIASAVSVSFADSEPIGVDTSAKKESYPSELR
jgi:hypothetical protein